MNYFVLLSGIVALLATIGHFTIGYQKFIKPVLKSDVEIIPKKVMLSIFHYISVFQVLSTFILIAVATGNCRAFENPSDVVKFIGITYAGFALVQIIIALTSSIKMGIFKLFQWVF